MFKILAILFIFNNILSEANTPISSNLETGVQARLKQLLKTKDGVEVAEKIKAKYWSDKKPTDADIKKLVISIKTDNKSWWERLRDLFKRTKNIVSDAKEAIENYTTQKIENLKLDFRANLRNSQNIKESFDELPGWVRVDNKFLQEIVNAKINLNVSADDLISKYNNLLDELFPASQEGVNQTDVYRDRFRKIIEKSLASKFRTIAQELTLKFKDITADNVKDIIELYNQLPEGKISAVFKDFTLSKIFFDKSLNGAFNKFPNEFFVNDSALANRLYKFNVEEIAGKYLNSFADAGVEFDADGYMKEVEAYANKTVPESVEVDGKLFARQDYIDKSAQLLFNKAKQIVELEISKAESTKGELALDGGLKALKIVTFLEGQAGRSKAVRDFVDRAYQSLGVKDYIELIQKGKIKAARELENSTEKPDWQKALIKSLKSKIDSVFESIKNNEIEDAKEYFAKVPWAQDFIKNSLLLIEENNINNLRDSIYRSDAGNIFEKLARVGEYSPDKLENLLGSSDFKLSQTINSYKESITKILNSKSFRDKILENPNGWKDLSWHEQSKVMEMLEKVKNNDKSLWQEVVEAGNKPTVSPSRPGGSNDGIGNTSENDSNNGEQREIGI